MKHAYLIIAHKEFKVLETCLELLDFPNNDIFIHLDKKVDYSINYIPKFSKIYLIFNDRRVDVRWGDCSQIWSELELYKLAYTSGNYRYFHLMSGQNLPIKSQKYIHSFFEKHDGKEFIGFMSNPWRSKTKIMYYHILTRNLQGRSIPAKLQQSLHWTFTQIQKCFPIIRSSKDLKVLKKGCTYCSLTNDAVQLILSHEDWIRKRYRWTMATDEIYKHTILYQSPLKDNFYCMDDEYEGCMLLQDWQRWNGESYVWSMEEWDEIMNSNKLFARKFSEKHMDVVLRLKKELKTEDAL